MSSDRGLAIRVDGLSKCYAVFSKPSDRLKQMVLAGFQRLSKRFKGQFFEPFWALKDVSFTIAKGECVAIVGRNGSGKSTLLQLITGTVEPTSGTVMVDGRVAALLELGSGFNPEFTGIENIYLNASLLGMSRQEVEERMEAILSFADIGEFVHRPVKTYSSGMAVRLAFAVQAQIEPDVLIVDEALAVGDARFQAKCFARLKELRDRGTTILLVTHSTEQVVAHCDRAILLDAGGVVVDGEPRAVVNQYLDLLYGRVVVGSSFEGRGGGNAVVLPGSLAALDADFAVRSEPYFERRSVYNPYEHRWGDRRAEIMDVAVLAGGRLDPATIAGGNSVDIYVRYRLQGDVGAPIFGLTLKTKEGLTVYGTNTEIAKVMPVIGEGGKDGVVRFSLKLDCAPGDYFVSLGIASRSPDGEVVPHDRRYDSVHFYLERSRNFIGIADLGATVEVIS